MFYLESLITIYTFTLNILSKRKYFIYFQQFIYPKQRFNFLQMSRHIIKNLILRTRHKILYDTYLQSHSQMPDQQVLSLFVHSRQTCDPVLMTTVLRCAGQVISYVIITPFTAGELLFSQVSFTPLASERFMWNHQSIGYVVNFVF